MSRFFLVFHPFGLIVYVSAGGERGLKRWERNNLKSGALKNVPTFLCTVSKNY